MKWVFKDKFDFDHRLKEASGILVKYPDKIPVSGLLLILLSNRYDIHCSLIVKFVCAT